MIRLILTRFRRRAMTCAEAGRTGAIVKSERERAKIRQTTIALARSIGRHDLAAKIEGAGA